MNIQEAYNKGLDDAEALVIVKITNALNGVDDGEFPNPELEKLRQIIFEKDKVMPALKSIIRGKGYQIVGSEEDTLVLTFFDNLLKYIREPSARKSVFSTTAKTMISKVEYELTKVKDVVN